MSRNQICILRCSMLAVAQHAPDVCLPQCLFVYRVMKRVLERATACDPSTTLSSHFVRMRTNYYNPSGAQNKERSSGSSGRNQPPLLLLLMLALLYIKIRLNCYCTTTTAVLKPHITSHALTPAHIHCYCSLPTLPR